MLVYVFYCFTLLFSMAVAIPFTDCGSEYQLMKVDVENCKYLPCPLFMKSFTNVSVSMKANYISNKLYQNITIITKKIKTPTYSTPEACEGQRFCPVLEGDDASFTSRLMVPDIVPFESKVVWHIINEKANKIMCFELDVLLCDINSTDNNCYQ